MSWEVQITGPVHVLDELARVFVGQDQRVTKGADEFLLRSRTFEGMADASEVRNEAVRITAALSGLSRVLLQTETSLGVGSVVEVMRSGSRSVFVQLEGVAARGTVGLVSVVVTHVDGKVEEHRPADPAPSWLARALENPAAAHALRLRDVGALSWTDLYRLWEVVVAGAGGKEQVVAKGWTTREALRRFHHSANSVSAAGDQARHGVEPTEPPANPMSLSEARDFVESLLRSWFGGGAV
jgi:hypothetical protein